MKNRHMADINGVVLGPIRPQEYADNNAQEKDTVLRNTEMLEDIELGRAGKRLKPGHATKILLSFALALLNSLRSPIPQGFACTV